MIHIDLVADWTNQAIIKLSTAVANGYSIDDSRLNYVLANPTAGTDEERERLLRIYYSHMHRLVYPRPREWKECKGIAVPTELLAGWQMLKSEVIGGRNLAPRLSRQSLTLMREDDMLNDWGVQHFHLGTQPSSKYPNLMEGTKELVYAFVTKDVVYAIEIGLHGQWANKQLLEKLVADYPEALEPFKTEAKDIAFDPDEKATKELRKLHVNGMLKLSTGIYVPPGMGIAGDGSSGAAGMGVVFTRNFLRRAQPVLEKRLMEMFADTADHVVSLVAFSRKTGDCWIDFLCNGNPYRFDCAKCIVTSHLL